MTLLIALVGAAHAHDLPENEVSYTLGDGLRFELDNGRQVFRIGGFVQPAWEVELVDDSVQQYLVPKRTQFGIDGSLEGGRIPFGVLTDFSLSQPLLEGWMGVRIVEGLTVSVGQKPNPANLREMLYNEGYLSFPDRSAASLAFSDTGREFGLFVDGEVSFGAFTVRPSVSATSGDGRNSFGVDSRDVDRGGLKWGGRLDLLPLGDFEEGNRAMVTDVAHESTPKLLLGGAFSLNDGASGPNGEGHAEFSLYDETGAFQQPDYTKIHGDLVVKWQGVSVLAEFVSASAAGLQGTFTDPVGGNPLFASQISEFLVLGTAINAQAGYHLPIGGEGTGGGLGLDLRYTMLQDAFPENEASQLTDATVLGAALTAFVERHDLKVQLAGSQVQPAVGDSYVAAQLLAHLRF